MQTCPSCGVRYPDALERCPKDGTELGAPRGRTVALFDRYLGSVVDGRYKIEAKLGEGGMGFVYAARHAIIDKRVAIKILKQEGQDESAARRFIQEAKSASKIGHANIVDITDFGTLPDGSAYFVMEFLDGETLGAAIAQGPLGAGRAISIAAQIARGLQAAHKQGIVHRDLKPDNVFLLDREGQRDFVKIVDFGIAKVQDGGGSAGQRLTAVGMVLGTPEYMAPEQATGKETDHRVDEYALGCILYEMLTGDVPFRAETSAGTLTKHVFEQVVPPRQKRPDLDIPPGIEAVTLKAMAKRPGDRYASMRELLEALDRAGAELVDGTARVRSSPRDPAQRETTLSVAKAVRRRQSARPSAIRSAATAALVSGGIALAGFGGWWALGHRSPAHAQPPAAIAAPTIPAPSSAPSPAAAAASAPNRGPIALTLRSVPAGATVYCDGERLGVAPVTFQRPRDGKPVRVTLRLAGYRDANRELLADADRDVEVALVPKAPARPASHAARWSLTPSSGATSKRRRNDPLSDLRDPFQ